MPVRRPAGAEDDARGLRVPLATVVPTRRGLRDHTEVVIVARGEARVGRHGVPLFAVEVVRVAYTCDHATGTVLADIVLTAGARRHSLFPRGLVVLSERGLGAHPGEVRWLAEAIAERIRTQRGTDLAVLPRIPPGDPVEPPDHPTPERAPAPSLPEGVDAKVGALLFEGDQPRVSLRWILLWTALLFVLSVLVGLIVGLAYPVFGFAAVLAVWFIGLVLGGLDLVRRVGSREAVEASEKGLMVNGELRTWREVGFLRLEGECPGPIQLIDEQGRVLSSWSQATWTGENRVMDLVFFGETLGELGDLVFQDALGDKTAWRDFEDDIADRRVGRAFWRSLHNEVRFAEFAAAPPVQPAKAVLDHTGWKIPLPTVASFQVGNSVSTRRAWTTDLFADPRGLGTGGNRVPWASIEDVKVEFRRWTGEKSTLVQIQGRLEVQVGGEMRGLGPWVTVEVNGVQAVPAGELTWLRETVHELWVHHRTPSDRLGVATDVPDALRAMRGVRQKS